MTAAAGPLVVHPENPRYFADGSGKAVYLTGSHTWANLVDTGPSDPPPRFGFQHVAGVLKRLVPFGSERGPRLAPAIDRSARNLRREA